MSDSTITTSGGLISQQFIENLRQPTLQHSGLRPETFALPGRTAPSPKELEENIGVTWELLKEKYDSVHANLRNYDLSEIRSKWLVPFFMALDFDPEYQKSYLQIGQDEHLRFALSHRGWKGLHAPILHMVAPSQPLDERAGQHRGAKSPHDSLQLFLNLSQEHLWSVVTNGLVLRILRDYHHTYTKGFIEFDLESIFYTRNYSDFRCLYRMLHASRFVPGEESKTPLELFYDTSLTTGVAVGADLRGNVVQAIETLGNGFLEGEVASRLQKDEKVAQEFYAEILHVVYRALFLLFAEQRGLLGRRHSLYAEEFSITALRVQAEGDYSKEERHADLWERLKVTFKMVKLGVPEMDIFGYNGALFDEDKTAFLNELSCRNGALLEAIRYLTCVEKANVLTRISYADLGVEELGSIYESLLDYTPRVASDALTIDGRIIQAGTFFLDPRSAARKSSGSYYTSPKLVNELIRSALLPVAWQRLKDAGLPVRPQEEIGKDNLGLLKAYELTLPQRQAGEKAILRLKVVDPATGSGAFLIAADNALGLELARIRTGHDYPTEAENRKGRRDVLMHCLYGVDLNPMAVELAKVSLWINACVDNQPLNFLDHRIRCGNSLIGIPTRSQRLLAQSLVFKEKEGLQLREKELNKEMESLLKKDKRPADAEVKALKKERDKVKREAEQLVYVGWVDSIPDQAFNPVTGDNPENARATKKRNKEEREGIRRLTDAETYGSSRALAQVAESIDSIEEQKGEDVEAKKKVFQQLGQSKEYLEKKLIADLWTAAFFWSLDAESEKTVPTTGLLEKYRRQPDSIPAQIREIARGIAERNHFFHWELEFPEVFEREEGGFDVSLGNPPWERIKLQEKEFFAGRDDAIAEAPNAATRRRMIEALSESNPELYTAFLNAARDSEAESKFLRQSGRFPLTAVGDVNTYMVFSGQFEGLLAPKGRAGVIVPSGIATDDTTKEFFQHITGEKMLVSLHDFENREKLFPAVDSRMKFCLLTLGGPMTEATEADFAFFMTRVDDINEDERHFTLSQEDFELINPVTLNCPTFRSKRDAALVKSIYRVSEPLGSSRFGFTFLPKIDMTDEVGKFHLATELSGEVVPPPLLICEEMPYIRLYEAKLFWHFDQRFATFSGCSRDDFESGSPRSMTDSEKVAAECITLPRYYVPENLVKQRYSLSENSSRYFLATRRLTNATNERTAVFSLLPWSGSGNSIFLFRHRSVADLIWLISNGNSFSFDYVVRNKLGGTNFLQFLIEQLPLVPLKKRTGGMPFDEKQPLLSWVLPRVIELLFTSLDLAEFAGDCGYHGPPFRWDEERRFQLRCSIDALFFHLYGISREDTDYIMDTFPIVKRKDEAKHGSYRTKEVILQYYDTLAEGRPDLLPPVAPELKDWKPRTDGKEEA